MSTSLLKWGDVPAATALAASYAPTLVVVADAGRDASAHRDLVDTLEAVSKATGARVLLADETRVADVHERLKDTLKDAGFVLDDVSDLGQNVAALSFSFSGHRPSVEINNLSSHVPEET